MKRMQIPCDITLCLGAVLAIVDFGEDSNIRCFWSLSTEQLHFRCLADFHVRFLMLNIRLYFVYFAKISEAQ